MKSRPGSDRLLLTCVLILVLIGILMVFSSSFYYALQRFNDQYYFFRKELQWALVGLVGMVVMSRVKYQRLEPLGIPLILVSLVLLMAVVFTPLGMELNGAKRWIRLGGITLMPGEVAKFAVVLFMASRLAKDKSRLRTGNDLMLYGGVIVSVFLLIMKQPNLSTALTIFGVGFVQLFVAGLPWLYVVSGLGAGSLATVILVKTSEYRMERLTTFMDPFKDTSEKGWQVAQSIFALGSGGFFGVGLGESIQNKLYIPEPQNDFIFATIGEEFGYLGSMVVIVLFIILIWRGIKIALNAKDRFGFFLATGIVATIAIQTVINIAVATSSMPVTGVPLPFISFGGNSLSLLMAQVGILLNISRTSLREEGTP